MKNRSAIPQPYKNAQIRRQAVLDYLHANPGSTQPQITLHIRTLGDLRSLDNTLRSLIGFGEVNYQGGHGKRGYFALKPTTRSAAQVKRDREKKMRVRNRERADDRPEIDIEHRPGVHIMGKHPIKNQGGQGCLRRDVFVNCSQNY